MFLSSLKSKLPRAASARYSVLLYAALFLLVGTAEAQNDLTLSATATPDPVRPGGQVTYTFTATNQSGADLSGVQVSTTVPGFVESFSEGNVEADCNGSCDSGESMEWLLGTLPARQSQSVTFSVILRTGDDAAPENTLITSGGTVKADDFGGAAATASVLASTDSYRIDETVDGRFLTSLDEDSGTYTVTAQLKSTPGETDISTSTVSLNYNNFALEYDAGGTATYSKEVEVDLSVPEAFALHGSFPNPFRSATTIRYALPEAAPVRVAVYDVLGRRVALLVDEKQTAGRKAVAFDARGLASGVYFYRFATDEYTESRKMVVVK